MKKDILYLPVEQFVMSIVPSNKDDLWQGYLINRSKSSLDTILVTSRGYNGDRKLHYYAMPFLTSGWGYRFE